MPDYKIADVARILDVSDDTVRRWLDLGQLAEAPGPGPRMIQGQSVVDFITQAPEWNEAVDRRGSHSTRNQLPGIITHINCGPVVSSVHIQSGRWRISSVITTEALTDMGLVVGDLACAQIKATNVSVIKQTD